MKPAKKTPTLSDAFSQLDEAICNMEEIDTGVGIIEFVPPDNKSAR